MEVTLKECVLNRKCGTVTRRNVRLKVNKENGAITFQNTKDEMETYNITQFVVRKLALKGKYLPLIFNTNHPLYGDDKTKPVSFKLDTGDDPTVYETLRMVIMDVMEKFADKTPKVKTNNVIDLDRKQVRACSFISSSSQRSTTSREPIRTTPTAPIINKSTTSRSIGRPSLLPQCVEDLYPVQSSSTMQNTDTKPMDMMKSISSPFANVSRNVVHSSQDVKEKENHHSYHDMPDLPSHSIYDRIESKSGEDLKRKSTILNATPVKRNDESNLSAPSSRPRTLFVNTKPANDFKLSPEKEILPKPRLLPVSRVVIPAINRDLDHRKLANIGNSCYMNATLQAISCLEPFMARMKQVWQLVQADDSQEIYTVLGNISSERIDLLKSLTKVLHTLSRQVSSERPLYPLNARFLEPAGEQLVNLRRLFGQLQPDFDNDQQQDAHEYWIFLIEEVDKLLYRVAKEYWRYDGEQVLKNTAEMKKIFTKHSEIWRIHPMRLLEIETENRTICEICGNQKIISESMDYNLLVNVKPDQSLQELVSDAFPCHRADMKCEKCEYKQVLMSTRIKKFPEVLVITLKRYKVVNNVEMRKCDINVAIQPILYTPDLTVFQDEPRDEDMECDDPAEEFLIIADPPVVPPIEEIKEIKLLEDNRTAASSENEDQKAGEALEMEMMETDENDSYKTPNRPEEAQLERRSSTRKSHVDLFCVKSNENNILNAEEMFVGEEPKLLGGAREDGGDGGGEGATEDQATYEMEKSEKSPVEPPMKKRKDSDDVEIIEEKVYDSIPFVPLVDIEEVQSLLKLSGITVNPDKLRTHLDKFPIPVADEVKVNMKPSKKYIIDPDGNCFYRAISWWLTGDEKQHKLFRDLNVDFIKRHTTMFSAIFGDQMDSLIKLIGKKGEWSNEIEIIAMCSFLKIDIYTFLNGKWVRYQPKGKSGSEPVVKTVQGSIYLTNDKSVHFNVVLACNNTVPVAEKRKIRKRRSPTPEESDEDNDEMPERKSMKSSEAKKKIDGEDVKSTGESLPMKCDASGTETNTPVEQPCQSSDEVNLKMAGGSPIYRLMSVVCHQGPSPHRGHYIAYTRNVLKGDWVYCSDDCVNPVSESTVLKRTGENGYLLYYTRIHESEPIGGI